MARELLHPIVAALDDVHLAVLAEDQVMRVRQLARRAAGLAPAFDELAVARKHLNAMVGRIHHVEEAVWSQSQSANTAELPWLRADASPGLDEVAVLIELADPLVFAKLGDIEKAVRILDDVADVAEFPRPGAGLTAVDAQLLTVGRVDSPAVVMRIADEQIAVAVDAQAAGPAVAIVGGCPAQVQEMAVAVEGLDAGREVDNVEMIVRVDGDGPRPHQIARLGALASPHELRLIVLAACQQQESEADQPQAAPGAGGNALPRRRCHFQVCLHARLPGGMSFWNLPRASRNGSLACRPERSNSGNESKVSVLSVHR